MKKLKPAVFSRGKKRVWGNAFGHTVGLSYFIDWYFFYLCEAIDVFPLNRSLTLLTTLVYINFFTYQLLKVPSSPNLIMQFALIQPFSFLTLPCKSGVTSITGTRLRTPFPAYVAISQSSRDGSR